ncbi:MAG: TetR family transcriptional regulator, partial [Novosphingobium sp.]|nr:TetR family transcriptional regulator [Novosphingobium sp.]
MSATMDKVETLEPAGARELLLQTASTIMREGDVVDISL